MARRYKMSRKQSRRSFHRGSRMNRRNLSTRSLVKRGGNRI